MVGLRGLDPPYAGKDLEVSVGTLKSDATPRWRKHLKVVYRKGDQQKEFWVDEDVKVDVQGITAAR